MGKRHWHPKQHYAACASNRYTISTSCESLIRIITNDACNVVHARNFWCNRVLPATESYTAELITRGKIWFIFYILSRHTEREREKRVKRECSFVQVCLPIRGHFHWIGIAKTRWHENIRLQFALYIHIDELLPIWLGVPAHPVEMKSSLRLKYHLWIIKIISGIARKASKHIVRMKPNKFKSIINISCFMQNEYHCEPSELPAWNSSVLAQSTTISLTYFYATFDFFSLNSFYALTTYLHIRGESL